jgi:hypothetical protein
MLVDDFLPAYDVSDSVAVTVEADVARTWEALQAVDFIELGRRRPLVGLLGALRILPEVAAHLLHGEAPPSAPASLRLRDLARQPPDRGGWVLLGERPGEEIALGQVARYWRPVITYAAVGPEAFRDFAEPGYAKTVYSLAVRALDERHTLLSGTMRTATTDVHARRWFRRYWTLGVGSGAHVLVNGLLEVVREDAEQAR